MEAEKLLLMAAETLDQMRLCGRDLQQMRVQSDVFRK